MRSLGLLAKRIFPDVFYETELSFYQRLFLNSVSYQLSVKFSLIFANMTKRKKLDTSNCRPIPVVLIISKVIKRVVHDQTQTFLSFDESFVSSGFRPSHSLSYLTDLR